MIAVTASQMQAIDRHAIDQIGIPGMVLMENAGRGATRCFLEHIHVDGASRVGILAGRGNNGGDGFVMARYLAQHDIQVEVFLAGRSAQVKGDAAVNLHLLKTLQVPVMEIPDTPAFDTLQRHMCHITCWIDALFGTGLNAEVEGYFHRLIHFINTQAKPVLAVDIPSGLNADTGHPCGICIQAVATATFGFPKLGQIVYPGAGYCGQLEVIDIGIPKASVQAVNPAQSLISGAQIRNILPERTPESHKGQGGHVLIVAGSPGKTGAAAMAAMAALRAAAGLVTLAAAHPLNPILEALVIEAMTLPLPDHGDGTLAISALDAIVQAAMDKQCLAIGPGLGVGSHTGELVARLIEVVDLPLVIDADGLNLLVGSLDVLRSRNAPTVLTPHPGEMARLTGCTVAQVQQDRIGSARSMAQQLGVLVILKGARTVIANPEGQVWINPTGNSGMASAGMGDVLTGAIAGLIAQGCSAEQAALSAVYLHGLAADLLAETHSRGYLATEVMGRIGQAMERVLTDPPPLPLHTPLL